MFDERTAWLALSRIPHLHASDATVAAEAMGGAAQMLADPDEAAQLVLRAACRRQGKLFEEPGSPNTPPPALFREVTQADSRKALASLEARLEAGGTRLLWLSHEEFPPLLRHIPDPPLVLFARGRVEPCDELSVAVVGSRNATAYGLRVVAPLVEGLVEYGVTIVSGMARGLDAASHRAALRAGGRTIAFLGTRIDRAYPSSSTDLYDEIPEKGCVLSEYPPVQLPNFPSQWLTRNRLIAGASRSLLVIEAGAKSGTANTVAHAISYDRPVYAVPGDITTERSKGTNRLIVQDMAKPVREAADILLDLGIPVKVAADSRKQPKLEGAQALIWGALANDAQIVDQLAQRAGLTVREVRPALTALEVQGHIRRLPSGAYCRT